MSTSGLLTLTQWLSPAFPVSAYAYSHGLEQVIQDGALSDAPTLTLWLEDVLRNGSGHNDAILLASAYKAESDELKHLDAVARAFASSSGRLIETTEQGAAFVRTVNAVWGTELDEMCYPIAIGRAARLRSLPLDATLEIFLHAFAATLVSVAVRLVPLGQTEGQSVLARLADLIQTISKEAAVAEIDDLGSTCFALDIAAMQHETLYSKVFRT